jgi:surface antigen
VLSDIPEGPATIIASKEGFSEQQTVVEVIGGKTITAQELRLPRGAILKGKAASSVAQSQWGSSDLGNSVYRSGPFVNADLVGHCTWYVYGRIQETGLITSQILNGATNRYRGRGIFRGNAATWLQDADVAGLATGNQPREGAIAVWPTVACVGNNVCYGHVAFVERIVNGSIWVSESNSQPLKDTNVVVNLNTNLYSTPEIKPNNIIWKMPRFTVMRVVGEPRSGGGYQWYELEGNGRRGWAAWLNKDGRPAEISSFNWNFTRISLQPSIPFITSKTPTFIYPNPKMISPQNNATGVPTTPTLYWTAVGGATYTVQVSKNPEFTDIVFQSHVLTTNSIKVYPPLTPNTRYWWRVNLGNPNKPSPWSGWSFTTGGGISMVSITVISPNGGEKWPMGSIQTIRWSSTGVTGNVRIDLSRNGGSSWETIIPYTANDGSEAWIVTGPATTQARIRVVSLSDPTIFDMSDGNFTISSGTPSIRVISPNGGEVWRVGSTQTITWTSSNLNSAGWIYIYYWYNNNWRRIAGPLLPTTTSFRWTIPNTPTTSWVWVGNLVNNAWEAFDLSDQPFIIR